MSPRLAVLIVLAGLPTAEASMPCRAPQVKLAPGMNATAAPEVLTLTGWSDVPGALLTAQRADGGLVPISYDAGVITGFEGPGWYTLRVWFPDAGPRESDDRSMIPSGQAFWADVLIGASDPGIALIDACQNAGSTPTVTVRWSEPVRFQNDPLVDLELLNASGEVLPCFDRLRAQDAGYDGGSLVLNSLWCTGGVIAAVRVARAPMGLDGSVATFPPEGQAWEITSWAQPGQFGSSCSTWQPRRRDLTHDNVGASGLGPSYRYCDYGNGCGCSQASAPIAVVGFVLLFCVRRGLRRRAR